MRVIKMAIKVKVSQKELEDTNKITVKIQEPDLKVKVEHENPKVTFKLNARKTLNGDIMIFDHLDIDIVILAEKNKVVAFAKDIMSDVVYGAENRLFEFLKRKGIVAYDSIQGGNVYGSLEGKILQSVDHDSLKLTLLNVSKWIDTERPYFETMRAHDEMMDDVLINPDMESSTEFGEVPHEEEKGSIRQHGIFSPYLYGRYTY